MGECAFQGKEMLLTLQIMNLKFREGKRLAQGSCGKPSLSGSSAQFPTTLIVLLSGQGSYFTHSSFSLRVGLQAHNQGANTPEGRVSLIQSQVSL